MGQRDIFIEEIRRLKKACRETSSEYLKRDYTKAINRKKKQLATYDMYQRKAAIDGKKTG